MASEQCLPSYFYFHKFWRFVRQTRQERSVPYSCCKIKYSPVVFVALSSFQCQNNVKKLRFVRPRCYEIRRFVNFPIFYRAATPPGPELFNDTVDIQWRCSKTALLNG